VRAFESLTRLRSHGFCALVRHGTGTKLEPSAPEELALNGSRVEEKACPKQRNPQESVAGGLNVPVELELKLPHLQMAGG
jgi:hypothetical protein